MSVNKTRRMFDLLEKSWIIRHQANFPPKKKAPGIYFPGLKKINPGRTGSGPSGVS
jgi:hypothetical protein